LKKKFTTLILLFLSLSVFSIQLNVQPIYAEPEGFQLPSEIGTFTWEWSKFWEYFKQYAIWRTEWYDGSEWVNRDSCMQISWTIANETTIKITLNFTSQEAGSYRFTFAIDDRVKNYVEKTEKYQYELTFRDVSIIFDWSDIASISGLTITHGVKDNYFWFRIRKDNIPANYSFVLDPSVVGTGSDVSATRGSWQHKVFYAKGRFWVFYCQAVDDFGYRSSTDGSTWSAFTQVYAHGWSTHYDVHFDGTYVHWSFCYWNYDSGRIRYQRGTPNADGTITWDTLQIIDPISTSYGYGGTWLEVDSGGYPWIGYVEKTGGEAAYYPIVTKSSTNDGTFSEASGFPYRLTTSASTDAWRPIPVAMTNGKVYVVYGSNTVADAVYGKEWNGSAWGSEETIKGSDVREISAITDGDLVYVSILTDGYNIVAYRRDNNGNWGSEESVKTGLDADAWSALCRGGSNKIYLFWEYANDILYKVRTTSWGSETILVDEGANTIVSYSITVSESYDAWNGTYYINVGYTIGTADPYTIKHEYFEDPPLSNDEVTITNAYISDTNERWVFAEEKYYYFQAKVTDTEGTSVIDTVKIAFTDGFNWINATYDHVEIQWGLDSGTDVAITEAGTTSTSGNQLTVVFHILIREDIVDALDVDIWLYANDTLGNECAWTEVATDYFNIYSHGGWGTLESSGDAGRRSGGDVFELYANASSWAMANVTYRWLQWVHMEFAVEDPSFTDSATAGQYHYQEWNATFGMYYSYGGQWIRGWEVVIDIVGSATYDEANDFNVVRARWYWKGTLQQTNYMSILWEGSVGTIDFREPPVFRFWLDLWFNKINGSRVVGGRLTPYYFGVRRKATDESDIWGAFFNMYGGTPWQPNYPSGGQEGVVTASMFWHQLEDASGNVITARELELMKVFAKIERSADFTYKVTLCEFRTADFKKAIGKMDGIDTPVFEESKMASMPILGGRLGFLGGIFSSLIGWIWSKLAYVADWTINAVDSAIYMITGHSGVFRNLVNSLSPVWDKLSTTATWISDNLANIVTFLGDMVTFIAGIFSSILSFVGWIVTNTLTPITDAISEISDFFSGTGRYTDVASVVSASLTIGMYLAPIIYLGMLMRDGFGRIRNDLQLVNALWNFLKAAVQFALDLLAKAWAVIGRIIQLIRG